MAEKKEKKANRRTQVKALPRPEKELSGDEQKKIKGGEIVSDGDSDARGVAIGKGIRTRDT